jgi:hypothetical protein
MSSEVFRSAFTKNDLVAGTTVSVIAGQYIEVGSYTVPAGEMVSIGYGALSGQDTAEGRIFMELKDTTATPVILDGTIRLLALSPQDRPLEVLAEFRTETLRYNSTDRTKMPPLAEHAVTLREDQQLCLQFKSDTTATLSKANSNLIMDCTKYVA